VAVPSELQTLGERLRQLRHDRGWKLATAAQRSGVSLAYLSEVERGRKLPSMDVLARIAGAYGMSVVSLLKGVERYDAG